MQEIYSEEIFNLKKKNITKRIKKEKKKHREL